MPKSPDAFRTISEVADWLGIQAHVLRFWESKFTQVKPIKRAGGRRYYRPADMVLLGGIKKLLHDDGMTIKGVQKLLREEGMNHVATLSQPLDDADLELEISAKAMPPATPPPEPEPQSVVLPFEPPKEEEPAPVVAPLQDEDRQTDTPVIEQSVEPEETPEPVRADPVDVPDEAHETVTINLPETEDDHAAPVLADAENSEAEQQAAEPPVDESTEDTTQDDPPQAAAPTEDSEAQNVVTSEILSEEPVSEEAAQDDAAPLPSFLRQTPVVDPAPEPEEDAREAAEPTEEMAPTAIEPPAPKPRNIDMPVISAEADIPATPASLAAASRIRAIDTATADKIRPLLAQLSGLRDRMSAPRTGAFPKF